MADLGRESAKQHTLLEMVKTVDAWLLWAIGVVVIGGGSALTTNFAFIIQAAHAGGPDTRLTGVSGGVRGM